MTDKFPGPKTAATLERGIPLFRNGLKFGDEMKKAGQRGFRSVRQIVLDKAHGDLTMRSQDILVVGKNLSGGIEPCAGIAARDDILGDNDKFSSGSTFAGTPAGCAAGIKTLEIFERDKIVDHAAHLSDVAADIMNGWEQYGIVRQVRASGLLMGVSFQKPAAAEADEEDWWSARAVRGKMLENGVWAICDKEETIRMYPALNMDESILREGLAVMENAIRHVDEHGHSEGDTPAFPTGVAGF